MKNLLPVKGKKKKKKALCLSKRKVSRMLNNGSACIPSSGVQRVHLLRGEAALQVSGISEGSEVVR